ncbi:MAG: hypothetical protein GXY85_04180 [Candidatus Brocadiaceae bacterium]|nr:hypothetical protein [Candidatus Brocadiaceae bacterium]
MGRRASGVAAGVMLLLTVAGVTATYPEDARGRPTRCPDDDAECRASAPSLAVDLAMEGVPDDMEEDPGAGLAVGDARRRLSIVLCPPLGSNGTAAWTAELRGGAEVRFYATESGGTPLTAEALTWTGGGDPGAEGRPAPDHVWLEAVSGGYCDITLTLSADDECCSTAQDLVRVAALHVDLRVRDLPEEREEHPGVLLGVGGDRVPVMLSVVPETAGPVRITVMGDPDAMDLYAEQSGGEPLGDVLEYETAETMPHVLYLQATAGGRAGIALSAGLPLTRSGH